MGDIQKLKQLVFESDNTHCFIERERILKELKIKYKDYQGFDKYALVLSELLDAVSTPVLDCDYFAGRVLEAPLDNDMQGATWFLGSLGHMSFDYKKLLKIGLGGIVDEICQNASLKGDKKSKEFAHNAKIILNAVKKYCNRYSIAAKQKGFEQMSKALSVVPVEPAYDFYSALSAIWIIHMIASCYVGNRDYAFGRFDEYMLPYYKQALADGCTKQQLTELVAGFFIKTNEICGRCAHDYNQKPILSNSSNQYINIGGENPNEFSFVVLDAAMMNNMAQPEITVLLDHNADDEFTNKVFEALSVLTDKMNIYNYPQTVNALIKKGIPQSVAKDYTYSACCTLDLNYHTFRQEYFAPVPQIFVNTLHSKEYTSVKDIVCDLKNNILADIQGYADKAQQGYDDEYRQKFFVFDALFMTDSAVECKYPGGVDDKFCVLNIFCPGIATIGDSLMVLDKLVFKEKRYTYTEFMNILKSDYEGNEQLIQEITNYTRFGNDTAIDEYAVMAGNAFMDAVDLIKLKNNFFASGGFYSLHVDNVWKNIGATPDGRKYGTPISENQSPTYGADKSGITALFNSLSKLPLDRNVTGGLNVTFSQNMAPDILKALIVTYFKNGGFHVGITVVDKEVLKDAIKNPDKYQSLTVRLYGFSEYFVSLAPWQQVAIINRTSYN